MQHIHYPDGDEYPVNLEVKDVHVFMHESMMAATHNYSCPVCRKEHAVLNGATGVMQPCWKCQSDGYKVVLKRKKGIFGILNGPKYEEV